MPRNVGNQSQELILHTLPNLIGVNRNTKAHKGNPALHPLCPLWLEGLRWLLLGHAVHGAQPPNEIAGVNRDDFTGWK